MIFSQMLVGYLNGRMTQMMEWRTMAYEKVQVKGVEWVGGRRDGWMLGGKTSEGSEKIVIGTHLEGWWKGEKCGEQVNVDFGIQEPKMDEGDNGVRMVDFGI